MGCSDIRRVCVFRKVERHKGLERHALGQRCHDPLAIGGGLCTGHNGWHEVRHDNCTGKMTRGFGQDGLQHRAIAQVQMPVVGAADREGIGHGLRLAQRTRR